MSNLAIELADKLSEGSCELKLVMLPAAAELRRLHAAEAGAQRRITELKQQVDALKASRDHFASLAHQKQQAAI